MITEKITKQGFIIQVLERDIKRIFAAELAIATENIYIEGKALKIKKRRGSKIGIRSGSCSGYGSKLHAFRNFLVSLINSHYLCLMFSNLIQVGFQKQKYLWKTKNYCNK